MRAHTHTCPRRCHRRHRRGRCKSFYCIISELDPLVYMGPVRHSPVCSAIMRPIAGNDRPISGGWLAGLPRRYAGHPRRRSPPVKICNNCGRLFSESSGSGAQQQQQQRQQLRKCSARHILLSPCYPRGSLCSRVSMPMRAKRDIVLPILSVRMSSAGVVSKRMDISSRGVHLLVGTSF